jgi:hypothetical protein
MIEQFENEVGFEVLTAVIMKLTSLFWDTKQSTPLKVNRNMSPPSSEEEGGMFLLNPV